MYTILYLAVNFSCFIHSHTHTHQHRKQCFFKLTFDVVLIWFSIFPTEKPRKREQENKSHFDACNHVVLCYKLSHLSIWNHANPVKCFNTFSNNFYIWEVFSEHVDVECGWTSMIKFTSTNDINSCRKVLCCLCEPQYRGSHQLIVMSNIAIYGLACK